MSGGASRSWWGQAAVLALLAALMALAWRSQPGGVVWVDPGRERVSLAAAAVLVYLLACALLLWRRWRASVSAPSDAGLPVYYASQTGFAEQLSQQSAAALQAAGLPAQARALSDFDTATPAQRSRALFVVSTTGEGDAPDSALHFVQQHLSAAPALGGLHYGLLALGDRSYPQFCGFGRRLDAWLRQQGAQPLFAMIEVDDADPVALRDWQQQLGRLAGGGTSLDWRPAAFDRWRLVERRLLNPGSAGGPAWHLAFEAVEAAPVWQAGDIAEVRLPGEGSPRPQRDYSIASLPADGRLELLVREMRTPEGQLGAGSAWLCRDAALGGEIELRIRSNRSFHAPTDGRPLILIGNGTGLAGLRALLKARAAAGQHRNWLLFGERSAQHDHFHGEELQAWQASGVLLHVDHAWSRDAQAPAYVQQRLQEQASRLRDWIAEGASVYVCGSAQGMAPAVDAQLRALLGDALVAVLIGQQRYRRDVY